MPPARGFLFTSSWLACLVLLTSCRSPQPAISLHRYEFSSPHMGTLFTITLYAPDPEHAKSAAQAAFARVEALEQVMSDYRADSELMQLCDAPWGLPVQVSPDLFNALATSRDYSELSGGAFDVTVGPLVRLWRFSRKRHVLPSAQELAAAREAVGWRKLKLNERNRTVTLTAPNMRLDLGGIGKGIAAEAALIVLIEHGCPRALVAASGDLAIGNAPPGESGWKISVADPVAGHSAPPLRLHDAGVSTSGDTEQFTEIGGVRYSHIVDPSTGLGLTNRLQITVIAPNATRTDALDTTLSVLGAKRGVTLVDSLPRTAALVIFAGSEPTPPVISAHWREIISRGTP